MSKRSVERERLWRGRIAGHQKSGLSVRQYCLREKLSEASFYSWKRELASRDQERSESNESSRSTQRAAGCDQTFVPLRVSASLPSLANLELFHRSGHVIRIPAGFDDEALRRLLAVLES